MFLGRSKQGRKTACMFSQNQYRISHIYKEGNKVVDVIANEAFNLDDFTLWYEVPESTHEAYIMNLQYKAEYRICQWDSV